MHERGWDCVDVVLVTGDTHVDHPSFPAALLGRVLEARGFRVGVISRPEPAEPESVAIFGPPRLFFGVTGGALDSMVANYTALRKRRSDDPYAPDGRGGGRPDRALTVYCNLVRRAFGKKCLIVAGGVEASLRRFAHYDYWSDKVRRPILMDCGADILVFGMGEGPVVEIAAKVDSLVDGPPIPLRTAFKETRGIVWREPLGSPAPLEGVVLPSCEEVSRDPETHARAFRLQEQNRERRMWQACGSMRVVANPPRPPPTTRDLDALYGLEFTRNPHPMYEGRRIPALEQVRFSVTAHRGCFGGCAFCSISAHQGKQVSSRSHDSVLDEVRRIAAHPEFRGTVNDLGGPTANMYGSSCGEEKPCSRPSCLWPSRCEDLDVEQGRYLKLLEKALAVAGIRNLFVTTGIRIDLALESKPLLRALAFRHTSGHLKVAPEHVVPSVLSLMRKPSGVFEQFLTLHRQLSAEAGKEQYVLPYLMAAHPGCRLEDMVEVALFLKKNRLRVEQCQVFTPTPGTAATVMYATGLDPATLRPVFVERSENRKRLQNALILHHLPEKAALVRKALKLCGREELIPVLLGQSRKRKRR